LTRESGKPKLVEKFLDRVAEFMTRETAPGKKSDDVCATRLLESEGHATVYVAKNGSLEDEDKGSLSGVG
jgi:hypothetical protein